jgi:hypothetical protein
MIVVKLVHSVPLAMRRGVGAIAPPPLWPSAGRRTFTIRAPRGADDYWQAGVPRGGVPWRGGGCVELVRSTSIDRLFNGLCGRHFDQGVGVELVITMTIRQHNHRTALSLPFQT